MRVLTTPRAQSARFRVYEGGAGGIWYKISSSRQRRGASTDTYCSLVLDRLVPG